jgi:hypothetical protein
MPKLHLEASMMVPSVPAYRLEIDVFQSLSRLGTTRAGRFEDPKEMPMQRDDVAHNQLAERAIVVQQGMVNVGIGRFPFLPDFGSEPYQGEF